VDPSFAVAQSLSVITIFPDWAFAPVCAMLNTVALRQTRQINR
jgi:hypothetical protein